MFLVDGTKVIGRDPGCDIVIAGAHVSRRHAELSMRGGKLWVKDLGSSNGTFVNGKRNDETALKNGDEVKFDAMAFKIVGPADQPEEESFEEAEMTQFRPAVAAPKPAAAPAPAAPAPAPKPAPAPAAAAPAPKPAAAPAPAPAPKPAPAPGPAAAPRPAPAPGPAAAKPAPAPAAKPAPAAAPKPAAKPAPAAAAPAKSGGGLGIIIGAAIVIVGGIAAFFLL
jgi:predicted component of type VI protein secretion system